MVLLRGYGHVYDPNAGPGDCSEACLLSDDQFTGVMSTFPGRLREGCEAEIRSQLEWFREVMVQAERQRAQRATRAQSHQALGHVIQHVGQFLSCAAQLEFDWVAEHAPTEAAGALAVFYSFPGRLRALAKSARRKARQGDDAPLRRLADAADHLADQLMRLDEASEDKIRSQLLQNDDYDVRHLADAIRIAQWLELASQNALAISKKRGGPLRQLTRLQVVIWLADLVERYGGTFTHNPYERLRYDGSPQTPAGQFVLKFLQTCTSISPQTVSSMMAAAIRCRNRAGKSEMRTF
ncbi:hypothetical protein [Bradyrhizobium sp. CCGUVB23]|uniref:hypothetical protein n=1 Tax=Bradyrhizobium sp. CCGUVB23 TaxID=2949630 RepID=UPI0020B3F3C9|nr:hypothetical protein [Bradyrhizobium sp. CCGUVB23]MCP3459166.1 hypothetical protein [Bradyrhizobium sp. CCGUVB23]